MDFESLSGRVIGCALEVHRELGPGLLESVYRSCRAYELTVAGIYFETEKPVSLQYKRVELSSGFRIDVLVDNAIILELRAVNSFSGVHEAQLLTYMKLTGLKVGLLINSNTRLLRQGIRRFVL